MTDLNTKFETLQSQLATQHNAIIEALEGIELAVGTPAPDHTSVLATISTQLNEITDTLLAGNTNASAFYSAMLGLMGQINTNTDTLINNNSLNAQRILIAIAANDPCRDCAVVPIGPPPIEVTPQDIDEIHCQRMQALTYALKRFTVKLDLLSSFGLGFSPTVIRDAIAEILTELGLTGQLEYPSLGEVAQLAGAAAAYVVSNLFSSTSLPAAFMAIEDAVLVALYGADSASAGQAAYRELIDSNYPNEPIGQVFKAMAYTSVFNLYYDRTIEVDLSGYDGSICGGGGGGDCDTLYSDSYSGTSGNDGSWTGYTSYIVTNDPTSGEILFHIQLDGVEEHTWSGNFVQEIETTDSQVVTFSWTALAAASGTITIEGCPSLGGGS